MRCDRRGSAKCAFNFPDFSRFLFENHSKHSIDIGVSGHLPLHAVARGIYELHQQSFNILQVIDSLDAKDHKTVPFASVPVPTVPADSAKQVSSETDVVKLFAAVQSVNAGVATHDAPQSLSEEWIVENLAWQPLRHALDQGPLAGSRWPTRSQLTDLFKFRVVKSRLAVTLILQ
jgi:hypothetical protein